MKQFARLDRLHISIDPAILNKIRAAAIKYIADQDVAKAEKQNNKKKYWVTNKICTNRNVKEENDLDVSSAQKKHDKILRAAYCELCGYHSADHSTMPRHRSTHTGGKW